MRTQQKHISYLHTEHIDWLKQLQFYKDDLGVLQKHLEEAAAKNSSYETRAHVERFQNQFIRQNEVIDELRHEIKQHENELERTIKTNPVATNINWLLTMLPSGKIFIVLWNFTIVCVKTSTGFFRGFYNFNLRSQ